MKIVVTVRVTADDGHPLENYTYRSELLDLAHISEHLTVTGGIIRMAQDEKHHMERISGNGDK